MKLAQPAAHDGTAPQSAWLWVLALAAVLVGVYGRFKGLGTWPLGVDEFYISRSVDNVLRTGLPEFLCGGYYARGLSFQYPVALLRLAGQSPEFAGRFLSALCSLAVLPAVYLLGRRVHSVAAGLLAVIVLALSVWEIEIARFARMYAPFQAVFAWYLVFFLRYTLDNNRKALYAMIALSVLGVLTWEGGALIGILNLLPPFIRQREGKLHGADWKYLCAMLLLFGFLYMVAAIDLRTLTSIPAFADGVNAATSIGNRNFAQGLWLGFTGHPAWALIAALPLALAAASTKWIWSLRNRWLAAAGLGVALVAALAHQLLIAAAILILLLLSSILDWRELASRGARSYLLALLAAGIFWASFGFLSGAWAGDAAHSTIGAAQIVARQLAGFPDVIDAVARPWGRSMPLLSLGIAIALVGLGIAVILRDDKKRGAVSALLITVFVMVLAVGAAGAERLETRYAFFLYPALVLLSIVALAWLLGRFSMSQRMTAVMTSVATLLCFGLSEDFQPYHVARIDSSAVNFRVGMKPALVSHYYPRNDVRSAGRWLAENVRHADLVVNGIPSLDQYYRHANFFFLDSQDNRYYAYACSRGTVDRWTNSTLLYTADRLQPQVLTGRRIFLVVYPDVADRMIAEARARGWAYRSAWSSVEGSVKVLVLNPAVTPVQVACAGHGEANIKLYATADQCKHS